MREAVELIADTGGFLLYLRQEGRGIGLYAKLDAYVLQDAGLDTYEANPALGYTEDDRDYTAAAQMLQALGLSRVALLSNNPDKATQLGRLGVTVTKRVPTGVHLSPTNARYLATKALRGAHTLDIPLAGPPAQWLAGEAIALEFRCPRLDVRKSRPGDTGIPANLAGSLTARPPVPPFDRDAIVGRCSPRRTPGTLATPYVSGVAVKRASTRS
jgi:hypothetical protein